MTDAEGEARILCGFASPLHAFWKRVRVSEGLVLSFLAALPRSVARVVSPASSAARTRERVEYKDAGTGTRLRVRATHRRAHTAHT